MKNKLCIAAAAMAAIVSCGTLRTAPSENHLYVEEENLPDAGIFLPAPPVNGSETFLTDSVCYVKGKELRNTKRGRQAKMDINHSTEYCLEYFAPELGVTITRENSPFLFSFLDSTIRNIRASISGAKAKYMRRRPFVYFGEPSGSPAADEHLGKTGSYPSGHSIRGWGLALILSEICPESATGILKKGYEYGESRVILGVHYESDVEAGRIAASAAVASLHSDKEFCRDLEKAKKEFRRLKKD